MLIEQQNKLKMHGIMLFPKKEDGCFSFAIATYPQQNYQLEIDKLSKKINEDLKPVEGKETVYEEKDYIAFNTKSYFNIPIFDKSGNKIEDPEEIGFGADVIVEMKLKEYNYRRKKGLTMYTTGILVLEFGEQIGATKESLLEGFEDELNLEF